MTVSKTLCKIKWFSLKKKNIYIYIHIYISPGFLPCSSVTFCLFIGAFVSFFYNQYKFMMQKKKKNGRKNHKKILATSEAHKLTEIRVRIKSFDEPLQKKM